MSGGLFRSESVPVIPVPLSANPGVLDNTTLVGLEAVCNVGSRIGVKDGSVSALMQVCIAPVGGVGGGGPETVAPDAFGRYFHLCIEFVSPREWKGKRRRQVPNWAYDDNPTPVLLECDAEFYWIGSWARFHGTGGTAGDKYLVTMTEATMQQEADARVAMGDGPFQQVDVFEPPCVGKLTAISLATADHPQVALPAFPKYHSEFRLLTGTGTWGGMALAGQTRWLPICGPITTGMATIYQTRGRV